MAQFNYEGEDKYLDKILSSLEEFYDFLWYCEEISWPCENIEFYEKYFSKNNKQKILNFEDLIRITLNNNSDSYSFLATSTNNYFDPTEFLYDRKMYSKEILEDFEFLLVRIESIAYIASRNDKVLEKFLIKNPDFVVLDYLYLLK